MREMRVINVAAGGQHSVCVTDDGRVWSWGDCRKGQLGLGDLRFVLAAGWDTGVPWPCLVDSLCEENLAVDDLLNGSDSVSKVSCGKDHTMFLTQSGKLYASGSGKHGALGVGGMARTGKMDIRDRLSPVRVQIKHHVRKQDGTTLMHRIRACACVNASQRNGNSCCRVAQVACGGNHSLLLTACGAVFATGLNSYGQLGLGDIKNRFMFSRLWRFYDKKMNVISLSAGEHHSAAIVSKSTVLNEASYFDYDNLKHWSSARTRSSPTKILEKQRNEALRLYQWGRGDWGQLGHGENRGKWYPSLSKSDSLLASPSKRGDFLAYYRNFENEAMRKRSEQIEAFEKGEEVN